ncbi:50S ribosomal protein L4 [Nitzschia inconspicua]|uniref:Large ribosomal subunit protein uL4m n=1 Tax=Nitzschia inconspicua TaxID=303405 RepID=A0A9K3Q5C6_9STRA|nr:50S ribosomal protein L4 [Nitzschia inconspicua]
MLRLAGPLKRKATLHIAGRCSGNILISKDVSPTSKDNWFSMLSLRSFYHSTNASAAAAPAAAVRPQTIFDNDEIPPNLTFDKKSSFAPKTKPVVVDVPQVSKPVEIDEDEQQIDEPQTASAARETEELEDYLDDDDDDDLEGDFDFSSSVRPVIPLPDRLHQSIYHGSDGSKSGTIWLNESVFGIDPIRIDLIKQSVDYIRNKIRGRRKAKTKTISEVSGSGRKVRQQKGSGKARAGHSRPAHWRGGAKAHGPKNTVDYGDVKMNKKCKSLAMRSTLSQKVKEGNFILVDHLQLPSHKTKHFAKMLEENFGIGKHDGGTSALIVDHHLDDAKSVAASYRGVPVNLWVASSNIFKIKVANQRYVNVYDILKREKLIVTLSALKEIENRWND